MAVQPEKRVAKIELWQWFLLLGLVSLLAFSLGIFGPFEPYWPIVLGMGSAGAVGYAIIRFKPVPRWNWWVIFAALWLFLIGAVTGALLHTLGNLTHTRSILPDLITIPGYALLAIGLLRFSGSNPRGKRDNLDAILDGLMAGLSILAVAWVYLIGPLLLSHGTSLTIRLTLVTYPPLSALLVVLVLRLAFTTDLKRTSAYWLLLAAFFSMFVGDTIYMLADSDTFRFSVIMLGIPYGAAYIFAGSCALNPSMQLLSDTKSLFGAGYKRIQVSLIALSLATPAFLIFGERSASLSDRAVIFLVDLGLVTTATTRVLRAIWSAKKSEEQLAHIAAHDTLTGLPNRRLVTERMSRLLTDMAQTGKSLALIFIDLDQFKMVNDTFGHSHGDHLLVSVAERLRANVRRLDLVARLGGDEFLVVLQDIESLDLAYRIACGLRDSLRDPFVVDGVKLYVTGSLGLATASSAESPNAEELLRNADTAMYQAKAAGRDTVVIFNTSMQTEVTRRLELKYDLRGALELQQLFLVYQPVVNTQTGYVEGVEALIRWQHPIHGLIPPTTFIPLAEESGLILEIGSWVMDTAVRKTRDFLAVPEVTSDFYVAVNLSAAQLVDEKLADRVAAMLAKHKIRGENLCIEITESMVMENPERSATILRSLKDISVRLAIDDFGSGYSSLAYLTKFPVDKLKIDKTFVDSLERPDSADATLIAAIVAMARSLGISTTAEGVETADQSRQIIRLGCDAIQGYYLSRPVAEPNVLETIIKLQRDRRIISRFAI